MLNKDRARIFADAMSASQGVADSLVGLQQAEETHQQALHKAEVAWDVVRHSQETESKEWSS
jgi:hypothetical protein